MTKDRSVEASAIRSHGTDAENERPGPDEDLLHWLIEKAELAVADPTRRSEIMGRLFGTDPAPSTTGPVSPSLTDRQTAVLLGIARGEPIAAVAQEQGITVKTAREHLERARKRLQAKTREEAIALAIRLGLLEVRNR